MTAVRVSHLVRTFPRRTGGAKRAVDDVSFEIVPGEIFGLLGPNGAGKTTTVKVLMTVLTPSSGTVEVAGYDVLTHTRQVRRSIGFVLGGEKGLYDRLTARANLTYFADLYGLDARTRRRRIPELLERVGLLDRAGDRVETFSRGMKQRLHIARGLLHNPPVVLLDEPSTGLDPVGALELRQLVRSLAEDGRALLLTTHHMREAEELATRLAVIVQGRIVATGTPDSLRQAAEGRQVLTVRVLGVGDGHIARLRTLTGVESVHVEPDGAEQALHVHSRVGQDMTARVLDEIRDLRVHRVSQREPTLEDAYVAIVSRP